MTEKGIVSVYYLSYVNIICFANDISPKYIEICTALQTNN